MKYPAKGGCLQKNQVSGSAPKSEPLTCWFNPLRNAPSGPNRYCTSRLNSPSNVNVTTLLIASMAFRLSRRLNMFR